MTPLARPLGSGALVAWRLDMAIHAAGWNSGEGAFRVGGRWNRPGTRAVYASLDPATAILEVAVHKGFGVLDSVPHVLTAFELADVTRLEILRPDRVPDPDWLRPGIPSPDQQAFGDAHLAAAGGFAIPSVVSSRSWNLVLAPGAAGPGLALLEQEPFMLDPRLHGGLR